jgi:hypothetical protein
VAEVRRVLGSALHHDAGLAHFALDGVPFTGVSYSVWPNGQPDAESELQDGVNWGFSRSWYSTGQPLGVATMRAGVLHGRSQEWHPNCQLKAEGEYEYGITIWVREWSADGTLTKEYRLTTADRAYRSLMSRRRAYGGNPDAESSG